MLCNEISIAIVDDHPMVIEGLKVLLKDDEAVSRTVSFSRGEELMEYLKENTTNLILLDIMLPDISGIELCKEIKSLYTDIKVLGLSNQTERSIIMQMLQNGASGYLLKNTSAEELRNCIIDAYVGKIVFSSEVKDIMAKPSQYDLQGIPSVTKREKQIIGMIAAGNTSQQIADALFLSPFTVETHRRNILQKLQVKNVAELIKTATEYRLL